MAAFRRASWAVVTSLAIVALALAGAISAMGAGAIVTVVRSRSALGLPQLTLSPDELRIEGPSPLWGALTVHGAASEGTQAGVGVWLRVLEGGEYLDRVTFSGAMEGELWEVSGTGSTHYLLLGAIPSAAGFAIPFRAEMRPAWEAAGPETEIRILWALTLAGGGRAADVGSHVDAYVTFGRGQRTSPPAPATPSGGSLFAAPASMSAAASPALPPGVASPDTAGRSELVGIAPSLGGSLADLMVDRLGVVPVLPSPEGWTLDLEVTVVNAGSQTADRFLVAVYFDLAGQPSASDEPAVEWEVGPLEAGKRVAWRLAQAEGAGNVTLAPGEHSAWVWVNPDRGGSSALEESNRVNNLLGPYSFELYDVPLAVAARRAGATVVPLPTLTQRPTVIATRTWLVSPTATRKSSEPGSGASPVAGPAETRTPVPARSPADTGTAVLAPRPTSTPTPAPPLPASPTSVPPADAPTRFVTVAPAPTSAATATATPWPSSTATVVPQTPTSTLTSTANPALTATSSSTWTPVAPTATSSPFATETPHPTPTDSPTPVPPTSTATPWVAPTSHPTTGPTPSPVPTATQRPTQTPEPSPWPTNTPELPTETPAPPTATVEPTSTPQPTNTPEPSSTPQPTSTPWPSSTPEPTDTPEPPTPTPEPPTATPAPTETPLLATDTPEPPTATPMPPEPTPEPPTDTPGPTQEPTATVTSLPEQPTATQ
ncbi:MAG: hypothetical protein HPY83_14340 [Anaerolineae bacterium]|nr:hypothetical protein [Anaerolineae bacterium]